jgi:hypothetical protein
MLERVSKTIQPVILVCFRIVVEEHDVRGGGGETTFVAILRERPAFRDDEPVTLPHRAFTFGEATVEVVGPGADGRDDNGHSIGHSWTTPMP